MNRRGPLWGGCSRSGTLCELLAHSNQKKAALLARVVTRHQIDMLPWPAKSCCQPQPLTVLCIGYLLISRESAPLSRTRSIGRRAQHSSATWNWRHRGDAGDGESGGRDVQRDGGKHARRDAAPNQRHSSFSYTCCPYGASGPALLLNAATSG